MGIYAEAETIEYKKNVLFEIQGSELKEEARTHVRNHLGTFAPGDIPKFFTLPGPSLNFEYGLFKQFDGNIHLEGVERDTEFYMMAEKENAELKIGMHLYCMKDQDYWSKAPSVAFDAIWLDYCGQFCNADKLSFDLICRRKFFNFRSYRNPKFFLTVKEGQERKDLRMPMIERVVAKLSPQAVNKHLTARIMGYVDALNQIANKYGYSIKPFRILRYRDRERNHYARPMLLFPLEIIPTIEEFDYYKIPVRNVVHSDDSTPYL